MIETCKTKLVNKILKIKAGLTASSQVAFPKDLRMCGISFTLAGKISTLEGCKVKNYFLLDCLEIVQMLLAGSVFKMAETNVSLVDLQECTV